MNIDPFLGTDRWRTPVTRRLSLQESDPPANITEDVSRPVDLRRWRRIENGDYVLLDLIYRGMPYEQIGPQTVLTVSGDVVRAEPDPGLYLETMQAISEFDRAHER